MTEAGSLTADAGVPQYVVRRVGKILDLEQVWPLLPEAPTHRVRVEAVLEAGLSLTAAHAVWNSEYLGGFGVWNPCANRGQARSPPRVSCVWHANAFIGRQGACHRTSASTGSS